MERWHTKPGNGIDLGGKYGLCRVIWDESGKDVAWIPVRADEEQTGRSDKIAAEIVHLHNTSLR